MKQKKIKTFQIEKNKRFMIILLNQSEHLIKKEKYQYEDHDDLDYYGIKDIEDLFDNVNVEDDNCYKPILIKSSFKSNCKIYDSKGDKDKKLSVKQYLYKIIPNLNDLVNDHKTNRKFN